MAAEPPVRVRTLATGNGRIGYLDSGDLDRSDNSGGLPPLVMLHACGTGARPLRPLAVALAAKRRVICPDFDGYGDTAIGTDPDNALQRHRRVLTTLLAELHLDRFDLLGHSMGGFIALTATADGDIRPRRLILAEPTLFGLLDETVPEQAKAKALDRDVTHELVDAVAAGEPERGLSGFMRLWNDARWEALPPELRGRLVALAPQLAAEAELVCADATPARAYADIACPLLLLQGEHAPPPIAALLPVLSRTLPLARLQHIDGVGHMGPLTSPKRFAALIDSFLDETSP